MSQRCYQICPQCSFVGDFKVVSQASCNGCGAMPPPDEVPTDWLTFQGQNGAQLGRLVHFCDTCAKRLGFKPTSQSPTSEQSV
jgi:hypothetical protein